MGDIHLVQLAQYAYYVEPGDPYYIIYLHNAPVEMQIIFHVCLLDETFLDERAC
jgi:hypothetical protein